MSEQSKVLSEYFEQVGSENFWAGVGETLDLCFYQVDGKPVVTLHEVVDGSTVGHVDLAVLSEQPKTHFEIEIFSMTTVDGKSEGEEGLGARLVKDGETPEYYDVSVTDFQSAENPTRQDPIFELEELAIGETHAIVEQLQRLFPSASVVWEG